MASTQAALAATQQRLERHADLAEAEMAALRRDVRLLKESHGSQLATLTSQLTTLQTARNTSLLTSILTARRRPLPRGWACDPRPGAGLQ